MQRMVLNPLWQTIPRQIAPRFGNNAYQEILSALPAVKLTREQQRVVSLADRMAVSPDLSGLPQYLDLLSSPSYEHVINVAIRFRKDKTENKQRLPFHTPFTDLFSLQSLGAAGHNLILSGLKAVIKQPVNDHVIPNATKTLADIYFYSVRPEGALFQKYPQQVVELQRLQDMVLQTLHEVITDPTYPLQARRLLKNELAIALRYSHKARFSPVAQQQMEQQLQPLLRMMLPLYAPPLNTQPDAIQLVHLIRQADVRGLRAFSRSGRLAAVVPQWARLAGRNRYQHETQDYPLNEHTFKVFAATPKSRFFPGLKPHEKFLTLTAALFHDISKRTGPKNFWEGKRITPDPTHPPRCAETSLEILPALGYAPQDVADLHGLIDAHSELGDNVNPNAPEIVPPSVVQSLATMLGKKSILKMLLALTEADIRSVKRDVPGQTWYTPELDQRLEILGQTLEPLLPV